MQEKLGATMHAVGYSTICNNIIEYPLKVFEEGSYGEALRHFYESMSYVRKTASMRSPA